MSDAEKWNARYRTRLGGAAEPARVLSENQHLLPASGRALDLASGLGGNALLLAQHGFETHAWDISDVALQQLQQEAMHLNMEIHCLQRDLTTAPPEMESFDIIVVSRFLDRALCPAIAQALKPGGLLFYQTYTIDSSTGPANPAYRLQHNELLRLFSGLEIVFYREEGMVSPSDGEAMLIARRA
jgi:SAM-dependent methyltransferase